MSGKTLPKGDESVPAKRYRAYKRNDARIQNQLRDWHKLARRKVSKTHRQVVVVEPAG